MFNFFNRKINQLYLRHRCQYLRTDSCGNRIFQAPYFDSDVVKLIHVEPSLENYLVTYSFWFDDDCFYDEYFPGHELISES